MPVSASPGKPGPLPPPRPAPGLYACLCVPHADRRIRYFGFLANVSRGHTIPLIRQSLDQSPQLPEKIELSVEEMMLQLTGNDITRCPRSRTGTIQPP